MVKNLLIQVHWTDLEGYRELIKGPVLGLLAEVSEKFDNVVLVCADTPENKAVEEFAARHSLKCFKGADTDILRRFKDCMDEYSMASAARILLYWFMVDVPYLIRCLDALEGAKADYLSMPIDFDAKFGGDVFAYSFLSKAEALLSGTKSKDHARYLFCPWALTELNPEAFVFADSPEVPSYGKERLDEIRKIVDAAYPERAPGTEVSDYEFAASFLGEAAEDIADISCGFGVGTEYLAIRFKSVVGIDYDKAVIDKNIKRTGELENLVFRAGDATDQGLFKAASLSAVISMHSMEHFPDDEAFLENCSRWLRQDGVMVLEVPLRYKYPFATDWAPIGSAHIREYTKAGLRSLCERYFKIEKSFGVTRGLYLAPEMARNAVLLVMKNKRCD